MSAARARRAREKWAAGGAQCYKKDLELKGGGGEEPTARQIRILFFRAGQFKWGEEEKEERSGGVLLGARKVFSLPTR